MKKGVGNRLKSCYLFSPVKVHSLDVIEMHSPFQITAKSQRTKILTSLNGYSPISRDYRACS